MENMLDEKVHVFNTVGVMASDLWKSALKMQGASHDPKMVSIMLYGRLWSNFRGFKLLWSEHLSLEADILMRSAIETTICLAALRKEGAKFVEQLRSDAAATMQTQTNLLRAAGEAELAQQGKAELRSVFGELQANGKKHRPLNLKTVADCGDVSWLYDEHRSLSGLASHVTGLSLILDVQDAVNPDEERRLRQQARFHEVRLHKMSGFAIVGCREHAINVDDTAMVKRLETLLTVWRSAMTEHVSN